MNSKEVLVRAKYIWGIKPQDLIGTFSNWKRRKARAIMYSYVSDIPPSIDVYPWGSFHAKVVYDLTKIQEYDDYQHEKAKILQMKNATLRRRQIYQGRMKQVNTWKT